MGRSPCSSNTTGASSIVSFAPKGEGLAADDPDGGGCVERCLDRGGLVAVYCHFLSVLLVAVGEDLYLEGACAAVGDEAAVGIGGALDNCIAVGVVDDDCCTCYIVTFGSIYREDFDLADGGCGACY